MRRLLEGFAPDLLRVQAADELVVQRLQRTADHAARNRRAVEQAARRVDSHVRKLEPPRWHGYNHGRGAATGAGTDRV